MLSLIVPAARIELARGAAQVAKGGRDSKGGAKSEYER